jgi:glycosyltransferase involved in cell wall biosynthesis
MKKITIIIPVYNEVKTILPILDLVRAVNLDLEKEIIVIDDKSTDGTREILANLAFPGLRVIFQPVNKGKGSAVRAGFAESTGDIIVIQDADLEYRPNDYPKLLAPILAGHADVVYGSRVLGGEAKRVIFFWYALGNRFLTLLSNMLTNLNLTDMETCYKVMTREVLDSLRTKLTTNRFGIEPELTAHFARGGWRIYEVGISYDGRTYAEGKKINWRDGVAALWYIIKFNLLK